MKRRFIHGLWGVYDASDRLKARRFLVDKDITNTLNNPYSQPFTAYVMGKENYKVLLDTGIEKKGHEVKLISDEPFMFDLVKYQYRNKMEILKYAMNTDDYDEIVYLDWDCVPQKPLPENFWEECMKKGKMQTNLQNYIHKKCLWRPKGQCTIPNGGFIYIRDKTVPDEAIKWWEMDGIRQQNDEIAYSRMMEDWMGGWDDTALTTFWDKYESMFCNLFRSSPYDAKLLNTKNLCFVHYFGGPDKANLKRPPIPTLPLT